MKQCLGVQLRSLLRKTEDGGGVCYIGVSGWVLKDAEDRYKLATNMQLALGGGGRVFEQGKMVNAVLRIN